MREALKLATLLLAASAALLLPARAAPDAATLLAQADQARGGGLPGLTWTARLKTTGTGSEYFEPMTVAVEAIASASIAVVQSPESSRGFTLLQIEREMWLTKPGLSEPVSISPRQRLAGQVAIGDIAATNYAKEYDATFGGEDTVDGEPCYVLELKSRSSQTTYSAIRYWISRKRTVAVRADYLALNGKVLKTATFVYGNTINGPKGKILFVSRITLRDKLSDAVTVVDYEDVKVKEIPASRFKVENL